jgi:hypothetical protein
MPIIATATVSASMGCPLSGSVLSTSMMRNFKLRSATSSAENVASSAVVGMWPLTSRNATSS